MGFLKRRKEKKQLSLEDTIRDPLLLKPDSPFKMDCNCPEGSMNGETTRAFWIDGHYNKYTYEDEQFYMKRVMGEPHYTPLTKVLAVTALEDAKTKMQDRREAEYPVFDPIRVVIYNPQVKRGDEQRNGRVSIQFLKVDPNGQVKNNGLTYRVDNEIWYGKDDKGKDLSADASDTIKDYIKRLVEVDPAAKALMGYEKPNNIQPPEDYIKKSAKKRKGTATPPPI